jgi:hypothetical protein
MTIETTKIDPSAAYLYKGMTIYEYWVPGHTYVACSDPDIETSKVRLTILDKMLGKTLNNKTEEFIKKLYTRIDDLIIKRDYETLLKEKQEKGIA